MNFLPHVERARERSCKEPDPVARLKRFEKEIGRRISIKQVDEMTKKEMIGWAEHFGLYEKTKDK